MSQPDHITLIDLGILVGMKNSSIRNLRTGVGSGAYYFLVLPENESCEPSDLCPHWSPTMQSMSEGIQKLFALHRILIESVFA